MRQLFTVALISQIISYFIYQKGYMLVHGAMLPLLVLAPFYPLVDGPHADIGFMPLVWYSTFQFAYYYALSLVLGKLRKRIKEQSPR